MEKMMKKLSSVLFVLGLMTSSLMANSMYKINYNNTEVEIATWQAKISGNIETEAVGATRISSVSFQDTLNYGDSNHATYMALNIDNDSNVMPDVKFSTFILKETSLTDIEYGKKIEIGGTVFGDDTNVSDLAVDTQYIVFNTILYGYVEKEYLKFNMGVNLKYVNFKQDFRELSSSEKAHTEIEGFSLVPYLGVDYNFKKYDTSVYANISTLSSGDIEVKDYAYGINYHIMDDMYVSYGYKYEGVKDLSGTDKFDFQTTGQTISFHLKF